MSVGLADPKPGDSAEAQLRKALARGDGQLEGIVPVLSHLLDGQDGDFYSESVVARVRGMLADLAAQLCATLAAGGVGLDAGPLAARMVDSPALLGHLHAEAVEWQLTERLGERLGLDPVVPPLLQALIASEDADTAELAMRLLAAQARYLQHLRRMRQPLDELSGEALLALLAALRACLAEIAESEGLDPAGVDVIAGAAERRIAAGYAESATRLGLLARAAGGMGAGSVAALDVAHGGVAMFASALALATGQSRARCVLIMQDGQAARLALSLRAAGLKGIQVEEALLALQPNGHVPRGLDQLSVERAASLVAWGGAGGAA